MANLHGRKKRKSRLKGAAKRWKTRTIEGENALEKRTILNAKNNSCTGEGKGTEMPASVSKISGNLDKYAQSNVDSDDKHGFVLIDTAILCSFLNQNIHCEQCSGTVKTFPDWSISQGYAVSFSYLCAHCRLKKRMFYSSKQCDMSGIFECSINRRPYEVNMRLVTFIREIGKGQNALKQFSTILNTTGMDNVCYNGLVDKLHDASESQAMESMIAAAQEEKDDGGDENTVVSIDGS